MTSAEIQNKVLDTLTGLKEEMNGLRKEVHDIKEYLEDTKLTSDEKKLLDESIVKIKSGDDSDFVTHEELKKELGV